MITVMLVFAGGALGTAARWALSSALPSDGGLPVTFAINISGAFLLGALTQALRGMASTPRGARLLAFAGTGLLGGYTTYGMFAVDTDGLLDMAHLADGIVFGGLGIIVGVAAAAAGAAVTSRAQSAVRRSRVST
jgi:CrcB protein